MRIAESELILNNDGSIFHLHLKPENIADTIILVGDPGRVEIVSSFFDSIEFKVTNREFCTHTGLYNGKKISVLSTGIGTDNIDIVINELDALVNIDLETREPKKEHKTLTLIRLGTSGAVQKDIPVDTYVISEKSIGFDGMLNYYKDRDTVSDLDFEENFKSYVNWNHKLTSPYVVKSSKRLFDLLKYDKTEGVTMSAPGFYGPQGRVLRLPIIDADINEKISAFRYKEQRITNYEMESSALYGLSNLLGHEAITICAIIANRLRGEYSKDYKPVVVDLIKSTLNSITK